MAIHSFLPGTVRQKTSQVLTGLVCLIALSIAGCRLDMHDQPKYEPYEASAFFPDNRSARIPPDGTVAQGQLREDSLLYTGKVGDQDSPVFPFPVTEEMLRRGQEQYNAFCSPCHDRAGTGRGMIVARGMTRPPSFHTVRLREAPPGYIFDVITNGFGAMFSYASRVPPEDRWAIIAYIRALQLSQNATYGQVPEEDIEQLEEAANESEQ